MFYETYSLQLAFSACLLNYQVHVLNLSSIIIFQNKIHRDVLKYQIIEENEFYMISKVVLDFIILFVKYKVDCFSGSNTFQNE